MSDTPVTPAILFNAAALADMPHGVTEENLDSMLQRPGNAYNRRFGEALLAMQSLDYEAIRAFVLAAALEHKAWISDRMAASRAREHYDLTGESTLPPAGKRTRAANTASLLSDLDLGSIDI